jgi:methylmalonyl-CoA epimerase
MAIKRIDHIAVVVESLDAALATYEEALGMTASQVETIAEQDVKIAFLPTGDSEIELLEPINADSGIARYLAKRGEGFHHICLEVDDLGQTLAELRERGIQLINETPQRGAYGMIAFIHPKGANGVLIELLERDANS